MYILFVDLSLMGETNPSDSSIVFIYNAKSGLINGIFDYVHKFVSPDTYSCSLCSLTYDNTGKKNDWADYLKSLPYEVIFAYKDNMHLFKYGLFSDQVMLPAVFVIFDDKKIEIISSNKMNQINSLDELIDLINLRLSSF